MFAGHSRYRPMAETLFRTVVAKKRAEVAPGVGRATDMFTIGPDAGTFSYIGNDVRKDVEAIYEESRKKEQRITLQAEKKVNAYVEQLITDAVARQQQESKAIPQDSGGNSPADQKALRDGSNAEQSEDNGNGGGGEPIKSE